jgi:hypothetical protein
MSVSILLPDLARLPLSERGAEHTYEPLARIVKEMKKSADLSGGPTCFWQRSSEHVPRWAFSNIAK